jgi:hypothetical protein
MPKLYFQNTASNTNINIPDLPLPDSNCLCPSSCLYDIVNDLFQMADWQLKYEVTLEDNIGLKAQLEECMSGHKKKGYSLALMDMDIANKAVIKQEYMNYIIKYGVPEDGLFLPSLLFDCMCDC